MKTTTKLFQPLEVRSAEDAAEAMESRRTSLDAAMAEVESSFAIGTLDAEEDKRNSKANTLYSEHQGELEALARKLYGIVPVSGPYDAYGFVHPANALKNMRDNDALLAISEEDRRSCSKALGALGRLWERQSTMQGMQLARNALLSVVLSDPDLREGAFAKAGALLDDCAETFRRNGISLLG